MDTILDVATDETPVENAVPIREISRVTGINTVTLRAWERRYGLLIPQRTTKGHRLYSGADIERVKEIQLWLGRGLAISKVKALLADERRGDVVPEIESIWLQLALQIQVAITAFDRNRLERLIADTFALYPPEMIADYLLLPLWLELQGDEPGRPARRAFFTAVIQEYLQAAQSRQRQVAQEGQILVLSAAAADNPMLPQVFNYGLLVNQYQADFFGYLNTKESMLVAEALAVKIIVLVGYEALNISELQLHLKALGEKLSVPIVLVGHVAFALHALNSAVNNQIYYCDGQRQAVDTINQLLKG